jgi:hypothetical protein
VSRWNTDHTAARTAERPSGASSRAGDADSVAGTAQAAIESGPIIVIRCREAMTLSAHRIHSSLFCSTYCRLVSSASLLRLPGQSRAAGDASDATAVCLVCHRGSGPTPTVERIISTGKKSSQALLCGSVPAATAAAWCGSPSAEVSVCLPGRHRPVEALASTGKATRVASVADSMPCEKVPHAESRR